MNIQFAPEHQPRRRVNIKVIGVGGAGGNAVNRMIENGLAEVDFFAVNTDGQALERSHAHQTLVIGNDLTRGLGAGGDPQIGRQAAEEDRETLRALVADADMVFVTAGMGGGTGTGAAPVVAEVAREAGALTVAVVSRPFLFEGFRRMEQAEAGLLALREHVDALLVIPNERLMEIDLPDGGMTEVFRVADNVLYEATRGISDIIAQHAVVNLDFADVRTVMKDSGAAIMGTGRATGEDRARVAAEQAIRSPLLEDVDIAGSRAVLVYLSAGSVGREDLGGAMGYIHDAAGPQAHVFFGFTNDEDLGDELRVTVIATGFAAAGDAAAASVATEGLIHGPRITEAPLTDAGDAASADAPHPESETSAVEEPEARESEVTAAGDPPAEDLAAEQVTREAGTMPRTEPDVAAPQQTAPEPPGEASPGEPVPSPEPAPEPARAAEPPPAMEAMPPPPEQQERHEKAATENLAALAAAAGGRERTIEPAPPAMPTAPAGPPADPDAPGQDASPTSRRFLDPVGSIPIDPGETTGQPRAGSRFRSSVLGDDKQRPAWERKYVD
jgi:cell division protein FtsZ